MISYQFYTADGSINVEYKLDAISLNQSQVQVLDVVGLDAAELALGFRFSLLDYSQKSFLAFAVAHDLILRVSGPNITTQILNAVVATGIQLIPATLDLSIGDDPYQLEVFSLPSGTVFGEAVTYESDDETVATVDANGLVTVVDGGTCTITATCGDFEDTCEVTIVEDGLITLTSATGTNEQEGQASAAITNITYTYEESIDSIVWTGTAGATTPPTGITVNVSVAGAITISGTPTVAGTYGYTITIAGEEGGAEDTATGTLTISIDAVIDLSSAVGTDEQSVVAGVAITNITYDWEGGENTITWTGTAGATTPPTGITVADVAGTITISGTPSVAGNYEYVIDVTGDNNLTEADVAGTITVTTE